MGGHTGGCMIPTERARPNEPARGHTHVRTRTHARAHALRMRSACALRARNPTQHGRHGGARLLEVSHHGGVSAPVGTWQLEACRRGCKS